MRWLGETTRRSQESQTQLEPAQPAPSEMSTAKQLAGVLAIARMWGSDAEAQLVLHARKCWCLGCQPSSSRCANGSPMPLRVPSSHKRGRPVVPKTRDTLFQQMVFLPS